jgi:hypothetical protein
VRDADDDTAPSPEALLRFDCPRCAAPAAERFYGPCASCRDELATTITGEARDVEVAAYEPKVNVTPNAVALKG